MCAFFEFFMGHQSQIPGLLSLACVALFVWGIGALHRNGYWLIALLVLPVALALDPILLVWVYNSFGKPPSEALFFYSVRASIYLAPWIAVGTCFLVGTVLNFLSRRTYQWLPALILGMLFIMAHVLIMTVGWEVLFRIPKYGWGLQYSLLVPMLLLISILAKFPVKNVTPTHAPQPGDDYKRWIVMAALFVFFIICPKFTSDYFQWNIMMIGIYAIAIYGLNILTGLCGQVCAWQWTMFGIGAFTAAILNTKLGYNLTLTLPLAGLASAKLYLLQISLKSCRISAGKKPSQTITFCI